MTKDQVELQIAELGNNVPLLTKVRKVNGGKYQIEVAEKIPEASTATNDTSSTLLSIMNESDERFSQGVGARRGWLTVGAPELKKYMNIDVSQLTFATEQGNNGENQEVAWIGKVNPTINGLKVALQVVETLTPQDAYQAENPQRTCKKANNGLILLKDNQLIFSKTKIGVQGKIKHTIIQHDAKVTSQQYASMDKLPNAGLSTPSTEEVVVEKVEQVF